MFSRSETAEIRAICLDELVHLNRMLLMAGTFEFLCLLDGRPVYTHTPVGTVVWRRPHPERIST